MRRLLIGAALVVAVLVGGLTAVEAREVPPPAPVAAPAGPVATRAAALPAPAVRYDATVLRVEDGDTIIVRLRDGRRWHVRVLGIDTHEVLFGRHECGGLAGSRAMHRLLPRGSRVRLAADPAQVRVDRYHRLLRYVQRADDGLDVGRAQLAAGLAEVYVYGDGPYARRASYTAVERDAQRRRVGIWRWC
ncbi:thermonuclease family protein [Nocardioides sp. LML1-1-1.1]|uniref:thermonuclease family protein n=1 Tax=Nocardioides sp. LML1-1-1.1 TaxID=3135248 RepID=UPI00343D7402